ncbi:MAG: GGDEF domain-containing protein [Methylotenera sp.]|uniref:GGDEF domain-containing protein n=1 Tax=Methylotenera sp. TaxID=2051956 RepID=UPI002488BFEF|nr:GGDEF domain-containing protein [Methylotenera sp.]MDI1308992.1 GGDEF domain-containing protein [Methylotenera sp.]
MKKNKASDVSNPNKKTISLSKVLKKSELIKDNVTNCVEELSSVNEVLKQELANQETNLEVENAIEKSDAVKDKVEDVAEQLTIVNEALAEEIVERERLEDQLIEVKAQGDSDRHDALHDTLTGLPNRALFTDRLEHALAQANRYHWTLAVMFLDLDKFKEINDIYGHGVGDTLLQTISKRLLDVTREDDTVSRHGGDEFLYLLMQMESKSDIDLIAHKIINSIQQPCRLAGQDIVINPSIGISIYPKDGNSSEELINSADKAMYQAKLKKIGFAYAEDNPLKN